MMKQAVNLTKKNIAKGVERRMYIAKELFREFVCGFFCLCGSFCSCNNSRTCISLSEINTHTYVRAE